MRRCIRYVIPRVDHSSSKVVDCGVGSKHKQALRYTEWMQLTRIASPRLLGLLTGSALTGTTDGANTTGWSVDLDDTNAAQPPVMVSDSSSASDTGVNDGTVNANQGSNTDATADSASRSTVMPRVIAGVAVTVGTVALLVIATFLVRRAAIARRQRTADAGEVVSLGACVRCEGVSPALAANDNTNTRRAQTTVTFVDGCIALAASTSSRPVPAMNHSQRQALAAESAPLTSSVSSEAVPRRQRPKHSRRLRQEKRRLLPGARCSSGSDHTSGVAAADAVVPSAPAARLATAAVDAAFISIH